MIATTMNFCYTSCLLMIVFTLCYTDVKTYRDFPLIDQCGGDHTCLRKLQNVTLLSCRVEGSRPAVNLTWLTRNIDGDVLLNSTIYYILDGATTTTVANITVNSTIVNILALFICSAEFSYNIIRRTESQIIIENPSYNIGDIQPTAKLFEMRTNRTLVCGDGDSHLFVWKKKTFTNMNETILLSTKGSSTPSRGYTTPSNGVLTLSNISVRHEGIYICSFGNGTSGGYQFYNLSVLDSENAVKCDPHQYLEMGTSATIKCSITKPFDGVHWYNSSDYKHPPFVSFENNCTSGASGEFDVAPDGSLVISNVSLVHERHFMVAVLYPDEITVEAVVRVSVKVKPHHDFPLIDQCSGPETCLGNLLHGAELTCRVEGARPAVNLTWVTRSINGDVILNSETYYAFDGVTTTTIANVTVNSEMVNGLALFICSVEFSYDIKRRTESQIIIELPTHNTGDIKPTTVLFEMHTNQTLICGDDDSQLFVWKKEDYPNEFQTILLSTMGSSTLLTEDDYYSMSNGVLTLSNISVELEGIYICHFGNGISGGYQFYNLSVFGIKDFASTDNKEVHVFPLYAIVIVVVLPLFITTAVVVYCILHYRRVRGIRKNPGRDQPQMDATESVPMMQVEKLQIRKQKFVKKLKEIYQNHCGRWPLLPSGVKGKLSIKNGYVENTLHKSNLPSQALTSHHDIFGKDCSKRILLIGDHGMGKTTIALKAAYDWCENLNLTLQYFDIFILICLKDNRGATSIYQTIKRNLLPNESELEEDDIQNIILSCSSLVIVFDGFDEYFEEYSPDILHIIKGTLFPEATVLTTAKPSLLPEITETEITKIYIKGFNESARSDYTSKYYEKGEDETFGADNVYFKHLSNVPLFFTLLTYMRHNSLDQKPINSVTRLFDSFMGMEGEKKQLDSNSIDIFNNDLYAKAFESLKSSHEQISLLVDDFVKNITEHFYNRYVTIGVFEDYNHSQSSNEIDYNGKSPGGINFSHRLFQEWFAAHHLVKLLKDTPEGVENHSLKEIKPRKQPYLLRFASGLSKTAASRIIEYVIKDEDCLSLAILCAFEKDGNCKHMDNAIRKLCSKTLKFQKGDSELLQHSTTELLKYASQNMITVSALEFRSSLQIFLEISKMKSEHGETPLRTVRHLTLHESKRELSTNEVVTTIKISSCCQDLERLSFISRFKPKSIEKEDTFCKLKDPKPKVSWTKKPNIHFILNPDTGRWEVPAPPLQTPITPDEGEQSSVWTP